MHPNPAFRETPQARILAFARERGFGQISANGPEGPLAAQAPFEVLGDAGDPATGEIRARFHLARSNPLARAMAAAGGDGLPALLAVSGPDAYVSPNWYGDTPDQVPTWNYVAAHLRGAARLLGAEELRPHLDRVSAAFEERIAAETGARPWRVDKMSDDAFARMARQIVPAELRVERVEGTWKLNQNKPAGARQGAAAALADLGAAAVGSAGAAEIARLMRADPSAAGDVLPDGPEDDRPKAR